MPRRMITSEIWFNEKVASLPDAGRLLFIGIFSNADDDGRLKASAKFLKAHIFPYDDDKTSKLIKELRDKCAELGLIRLYTNGTQEFLDIPGWYEHQQIRKDRYTPSKLPSFEDCNPLTTKGQPADNQMVTTGIPNIGEGRGVKSNIVKSKAPLLRKGARKERAEPIVNEIFSEMRRFLGYPEDKVCGGEALPAIEENQAMTAERRDPIPNYGKEGKAIKRMLTRGFTREEILTCWKSKVSQRGGEFVSMTWVNEDIGKRGAKAGGKQPKQERVRPIKYVRGSEPAGTED